ncbi:MAG: M13 family metallopeptidase [Acidobacteriota bacterium]
MRAFSLFLIAAGAALAQSTGFDILSLNRAVDPCGNFYQFACGGWMASNPIPGDMARYGRFDALQERNRAVLQNLLESASADRPGRTLLEQKIGDYYAACMNQPVTSVRAMDSLQRDLNRIAVVSDKKELNALMVTMFRMGAKPFFEFFALQDAKDSTQMIAGLDQGGLGLPDRDYYLQTDAKSAEIRQQYVDHLRKMFLLLGQEAAVAQRSAAVVMELETALAEGSMDRVTRRDPEKTYHKLTVDQLKALAPAFDWEAFFAGLGTPQIASLNVMVPAFAEAFGKTLESQSLDSIKTYLSWVLVHDYSPLLSAPIRQESFNFFDKTLKGSKEMRARWKECVDMTDGQLPDALGQKFIEKTLGEEGAKRTQQMVAALEQAMERDIKSLDWMTPETKEKAIEKLHKITNKVGNKSKWLDYASVRIARDDAYGNVSRASQFEVARDLAKIGQPVDKTEWSMSQPTVNAYYDAQTNDINFPAGILQAPFYDNAADDAINFGGIGAVIGHELTHGFDDEGRQFDGDGNLRDWWTDADAKAFEQRADCLVNEYSGFAPLPGVNLNGKLTLGENTADNGGLKIAHMALLDTLAGKEPPKIDGFTAEQRLFLGWAQVWCQNITEESARLRVQTDPHAPAQFRVNGVVSNMAEFQKAFACRANQPMVRGPACRVW